MVRPFLTRCDPPWWNVVLWGEIKVDSDDLKHMVHRNGGFIDLYNNIMTCLGDLGLLLAVPPLGSEWFGPEVGTYQP